jgi:hypothetical protein
MDHGKPTTDPEPLKRDGSPPDEEDKPGKRIPDADEPEASRGGSDPDEDDQSKSGKGLV